MGATMLRLSVGVQAVDLVVRGGWGRVSERSLERVGDETQGAERVPGPEGGG